MPGRCLALCLAGIATSACWVTPRPAPAAQVSSLVSASCPFQIAEASAWINHMPGSGGRPRLLAVAARLTDPTASAILLKAGEERPGSLVLEVKAADKAPIAGRMAWRETPPDPVYERVIFRCGGGDIHVIEGIERVQ